MIRFRDQKVKGVHTRIQANLPYVKMPQGLTAMTYGRGLSPVSADLWPFSGSKTLLIAQLRL